MRPVKDIQKLISKLNVEPSAEMYERTLADAVTAQVRGRQMRVARPVPVGAVAAGLVLLSLLGVIALRESVTPAYAVEQTVAAIRKVPIVHILGRDWGDKRIEMWIKVNADTGLLDSCHIRYLEDDRSVVSTPRNTYDHDGKTNAVRIKDGPSIASIFCLSDFFQGMERLAKTLDGQITYCEVTDPGTKRAMLELKLSAPHTEIVCLIDPKTKLPISISVTRGGRFGSYDVLKNATEIHYGDTPPEGLFDFTIPTGANVSVETSEDPLATLPAEVLRCCGQFHLETLQKMAQLKGIPVNTRLFFVDGEFNLRMGGFIGIHNDSNEVWKDEIALGNFDVPNMAVFDASSGKKQQIRLVQHRQSPPGRFKLHWRLEEPLPPGQTRYGIYWMNEAKPLRKEPTGEAFSVSMNNCFGGEGIENFLLIVPKGMNVSDCSRQYKSNVGVDDYSVYAWQRHLPAERIVNQVDVALSGPSGGWIGSDAWTIIGPFDNVNDTGFETPHPPEKEIDFSKEYAGKEGAVKWFRPKRTRIDGLVDLAAILGRKDWSLAYAATSVSSPETRKMELRVGSDDDVKAWLNGELVLSRSADRGAVPDEDVAPVTLHKGENQLLLKVCNHLYSWGFYARIVDPNVPRHVVEPPSAAEPPKLPYDGVDGLVEFVHRIRQAMAVDRVYQIETKEEFALSKDRAARLTFKDNAAGVTEFLFAYDGNAVHVIYRCRDDTEREYNSTWLDLNRREDSRSIYATGATTLLKCLTAWDPKDGQAMVRFRTEKPSEQEQQEFVEHLQAQKEHGKHVQVVREQAIAVREWDLHEKVEPYTILMDDPNDPHMVELRTKYGLEDLVRGAADDYEKLKRVTAWAQKRWQHSGNNSPSKADPLTILQEVSEGKRFRCVEYAIVVTGGTRSLGMSSRTLGLMRSDVETAESGAGHVVAEVWLQQFGKWVMVDGQWGALAESKGVPLNALELQDALARKDSALTIRFVSQTTTADRQADYLEWIIPYLYYLNFGCDQRFYRSAAQGQPPQRGPIILVPKGANKPKAFQRKPSFGGATYISNPKAFYPPMGETVKTQSYQLGASIKATLEKNSEIRLDCPANPFGLNRYTIYYHVDTGGVGYIGIRAVFADGKSSQCEIAVANCDCILQQPRDVPYLGILTWQLNDGRLDVDFCASKDRIRNYETPRQFAIAGKRVCEQYGNRRLVLPDSVSRRGAIEDLDFLVKHLKAKHPKPFAKTSEKDFNEELERVKASLPEELRITDLSLSVAALLALVGDDHTVHRDFSAFDEHVAKGGKVFPVKLRHKSDRMTVGAWSPEVAPARLKVGDAVTTVNGQSMESLLQRYGRYISLETALQKWWTLEWAFDRYQVLLGDASSEYTLQLQDAEGQTYSETLPAVKPWLQAYEDSIPKSPRFHYQFYDDGKVCLFKLQTFNWNLRSELESKLNTLIDAMRQNKTEIAVLDLRGNGGGNSNMGYMVFAGMIDKPYGELRPDPDHSWPVKMALLCDRSTYSAASFEAMFFKDYGMGIVAGEETGGRASSFGDIEHVTLPNSRLVCGIATGYFPRRAGYDDGRGVLPDLPLDVTLDDGVLVEKICDYIRKSGG